MNIDLLDPAQIFYHDMSLDRRESDWFLCKKIIVIKFFFYVMCHYCMTLLCNC